MTLPLEIVSDDFEDETQNTAVLAVGESRLNDVACHPSSQEDGDSGIKSMETSLDRHDGMSTCIAASVTSKPKKKTRRRKRAKTPI